MHNRGQSFGADLEPGCLLVAHPTLKDPHFWRSVVFLTAYSEVGGAVGVVANQRLPETAGQVDAQLRETALADIPLLAGGPVASDQLILAAWKWSPDSGNFRFFFGLDAARAMRLREEDPEFAVCGFMGHAGWSRGQLEAELSEGAWLLSRRLDCLFANPSDEAWRGLLRVERPELGILEGGPEDPSVN